MVESSEAVAAASSGDGWEVGSGSRVERGTIGEMDAVEGVLIMLLEEVGFAFSGVECPCAWWSYCGGTGDVRQHLARDGAHGKQQQRQVQTGGGLDRLSLSCFSQVLHQGSLKTLCGFSDEVSQPSRFPYVQLSAAQTL